MYYCSIKALVKIHQKIVAIPDHSSQQTVVQNLHRLKSRDLGNLPAKNPCLR